MKKRKQPPSNNQSDSQMLAAGRKSWLRRALLIAFIAGIALVPFITQSNSSQHAATAVTFSREIAPIVYNHCAECHRPGQTAPFPLLTYADVSKRAAQLQKVTQSGSMPPWLPEPGCGDFLGERRLSAAEKSLIAQWVSEGAKEGDAKDLPALPKFSGEWQLGPPDVVVEMPTPFTLAAEGPDVYRSFVLPVPAAERRFVVASELKPGNPAVHHAFIFLDRLRTVRSLEKDPSSPGVPGINAPTGVEGLDGYFASWQPGKRVYRAREGLGWTLPPDADMVVQCHLRPTGKAEQIKLRLGLYFTQSPPTLKTMKGLLRSFEIKIPPGQADYVVKDDYVLPVDVDLLAVLPHAHFLGKDLRADVEFPNGEKRCLLHIPRWDFNWQGDYVLKNPLRLPRGTKVSMNYVFDNSASNPSNPYSPPRAVAYGPESTDEMAEFWFQMLPVNAVEYAKLEQHYTDVKGLPDSIAYNNWRLSRDPKDTRALVGLCSALILQDKYAEAEPHARKAIEVNPQIDEAHFQLGFILCVRGNDAEGMKEMRAAIQINPKHFKAHNALGNVLETLGRLEEAAAEFQEALRLNPGDPMAGAGLLRLRQLRQNK